MCNHLDLIAWRLELLFLRSSLQREKKLRRISAFNRCKKQTTNKPNDNYKKRYNFLK